MRQKSLQPAFQHLMIVQLYQLRMKKETGKHDRFSWVDEVGSVNLTQRKMCE